MSLPKEWEDFAHPYPAGIDVTGFGEKPRSVPDPAAKVIAERDEEIRQLKAHANMLADRLRDWVKWWECPSVGGGQRGPVYVRADLALKAHRAMFHKPRPE